MTHRYAGAKEMGASEMQENAPAGNASAGNAHSPRSTFAGLRLACLVLACLLPGGAFFEGALPLAEAGEVGSSDAKRACAALIRRVEPRRGIQVRSLVIIPLVSKMPTDAGAAPLAYDKLTWHPHDGEEGRDATILAAGKAGAAAAAEPGKADPELRAVLPTGMVLRRDGRERLLSRPCLVVAGRESVIAAPVLPHEPTATEDDEEASVGPMATPAQRRLLFSRPNTKLIGKLVAFEASVAGVEAKKKGASLASIANAPEVAKAVAAVQPRVAKAAGAYGGEVLGHVVFLGNRPVDMLLASSPAHYRAIASEASHGLALSLVLWERWHGVEGEEPDTLSWPAFVGVCERILKALSEGTARRQRAPRRKGVKKTSEPGSLWRVRGRLLRGGTRPVEQGWLLVDAAGKALLLEAWPEPKVPPLPPPAREPGGPGVDEDPHDRTGGGMTIEYLERLLQRKRANRASR